MTQRCHTMFAVIAALATACAGPLLHAQSTPSQTSAAPPAAAAPAPAPTATPPAATAPAAAPATAPDPATPVAAPVAPTPTEAPAADPASAPATAAATEPPAEIAPTDVAETAHIDATDEPAKNASRFQPPKPEERTALEARLKALDDAGLSDDDKKQAVTFYQEAIKSYDVTLEQIEASQKFAVELERTKTGDQSAEATAAKLAKPLPAYTDTAGLPLAEIERWADNCETALAAYRLELAAMIAEPKRRSQRMAELPKQIAETQERLKKATDDLAKLGSEDAANIVAAAQRAALTYAMLECNATLQTLDREQKLYDQGGEWVTLRRDYFARYVPHKEKRLAQLREVINGLRERETQEQARLAAAAAAQAIEVKRPAQVIKLANDNKLLADERTALVAAMDLVIASIDATRETQSTVETQYESAQAQAGTLSNLAGQLLRDQQAKLPDLRELQRSHAHREPLLSEVLLRSDELNDQSSELANLDERTDEMAAAAGDLSAASRAEIRQLLEAKRDTLKLLIDDYQKYVTDLNTLHTKEASLIEVTEAYADFIAERVLWIRSCDPPSLGDWRHAGQAIAWSLNPMHWRRVGEAIVHTSRNRPVQFVLFTLAFAALAAVQRPARRRLRECGAEAKKRSCTRLGPTLHALWLTTVVALPWPALLAFIGLSIDSLSEVEFVRALGAATRFIAVCLLLLEIARHLCRRDGLADAHFDWPDKCLVHVRHHLRWLTMLGLPLVVWLVGLEVQSEEPNWSSSLGRALFVSVMLLLAAVLHRILLAANSPFRQVELISRGGWLTPLQIIWRPAAVLLPAALAVLALVGYYFTAEQSAVRILQTIGLLLAVLAVGGITRRWLLVSRRRLAREQAKQRRAQLIAAADDDPGSLQPSEVVDEAVDLAALSDQTQKLVRTFLAIITVGGLCLIWGAVLPALKYPAKHLLPGAEILTWGDLVTFFLVLAVTYITVRDVPALLELAVLQHLPLDAGSRYAFTTMSRYALTAVGLTAALNSLDVKWANIQWLVAAMSVGLGFGLQEIFANFVSGIILLFERPIRVGDVVTLGEKTGVVSRIRMRATTIVDPDRKEYIVPNKDLVTERLLNWTLTDYTNRVEIVVSVATGTDTDHACALLLEAAREQQYVLAEPAPSAAFEGFTDTGLKLALRCFLPNLENRGSTIHSLHTAVDRKFRAAGIEGAYGDMRVRITRESSHSLAPSQSQPQSHVPFTAKVTDAPRQGAA